MIRRDIRLADGSAEWMLISQIEHARISAELASQCVSCFGANATLTTLPAVRDEVLEAILHHDDGWAEWEKCPRLDPKHGRPLAFTEIGPAEATAVWTRSIDAAEAIGPLAAWIVAGHFLRLAKHSDAMQTNPQIAAWREQSAARRAVWLDAWQSADPVLHTRALAGEALQWLWTFDEVSLWLCCTCSRAGHAIPCAPEPFCAGRGTPIEMELLAVGVELATAVPWRLAVREIKVAAAGQVVPAAPFGSPAELLASAAPRKLRWLLIPARIHGETPTAPRS